MKERYEDYKIFGINPFGSKEQRVHCPECAVRMPYKHAHSERTSKDLAVNIDLGTWMCHRCDWRGALKEIKIETNHKVFKPVPVKPRTKPCEEDKTFKMYEYFRVKRKIPKDILIRNKVALEKAYFAESKQEENAIVFNYFVDGILVNAKYRSMDKKFAQVKGGQKVFYKLDDIKEQNYCIITEGEIDALSFETAGYKSAISIPDGAINPKAENIQVKMQFLDNCFQHFAKIDKIILALDTDAPGLRMREELARRFGKSKCFILRFPEGCKDGNEVLVNHGVDTLAQCVENAIPYPVEGYFKAEDSIDEMNSLYENGYPDGAKTGWHNFDEKIKFFPSIISTITGLPSHGKSNFLDELMVRLAIKSGTKFGVFSSENGTKEIHLHRLCEIIIGKPLLPTYNGRMSREEMNQALEFINEHFYFIEPKDNNNSMESIIEISQYLVQRFGIKGLILDPWNTIDHEFGKDTETEYTKKMLNKLTFFEREHGLMLFIVAHPTKMPKVKGKSKYEIPTLYDINGSSNWYNKTELGISVYRDFSDDFESTNWTGVFIQKVKHKYWGRTGMVKFHFDPSCQRFYEDGYEPNKHSFLSNINQEPENNYILDYELTQDEPPPF